MKSLEFSFENKSDIKLLIMYVLFQAKTVAKQEYLNKNFFSDFIMESVKISYFDLHDTIFTLAEEGYIVMFVKNHKDVLEITQKGMETVGYFFKYIPLSIRDRIDECIYDGRIEWSTIRNRMRDDISRLLYDRTKRSPMVLPLITTV